MSNKGHFDYWQIVRRKLFQNRLGLFAFAIVFFFLVIGIYAPLLASSKPLMVQYKGTFYFPLFRYLFYPQFFTKPLDRFYNLLMFTFPLAVLAWVILRHHLTFRFWTILCLAGLHFSCFLWMLLWPPGDPAFTGCENTEQKQCANNYAELNTVLQYQQYKNQKEHFQRYENDYKELAKRRNQTNILFPTLWNLSFYRIKQKQQWLDDQVKELHYEIMPLFRSFHWEDDAGGDQALNQLISWWDLTRINRKDMVASLIFGIRISLSVGLLAIALALLIGIPIGAIAGYYGGKLDLLLYRLIEIWESMPTFFMLLMIVAFLQSKSVFLIIGVIGLFGWTSFSRFIRGEFFRQKKMLYVEACHAIGYPDSRIIFSHLLPNAIPPLLTLVPFAIMSAITSEAALSFLGLGEEGSNSWGVLMDEGRSAFPAESYLLWPPAILLTILLVSIAVLGDSLRDALDPKLNNN